MTTTTTGRFVWHELHTGDRVKAQAFYKTLMAWDLKEVQMGPGEPYTLCQLGGKDCAGIQKSKAPAGVPPHWLAYIGAEDVDATATRATGLGAKLLMPATDIPDVGRFAVLQDPQGAAFALFKYKSAVPAEPERPPVGAFAWDELISTDPVGSAKFYASLFGYGIDEMDMGPMGTYRIFKRGDRQTAGLMKLVPGQPPHSHWLSYLHVKEVDASTRNARELGAQVHLQPTDIPKVGRFSILGDPTGAGIALFTPAM